MENEHTHWYEHDFSGPHIRTSRISIVGHGIACTGCSAILWELHPDKLNADTAHHIRYEYSKHYDIDFIVISVMIALLVLGIPVVILVCALQ
jgi:hypothetical protein